MEKSYGSPVNQVVVESLTVAAPKSENIRSQHLTIIMWLTCGFFCIPGGGSCILGKKNNC